MARSSVDRTRRFDLRLEPVRGRYLPIPACDDSAAETGRPGDYEKPDDGCKHSEGMGGEGSEEAVLVRKEKIEQAGEPDGQKQP
jgi:hypothetical protein